MQYSYGKEHAAEVRELAKTAKELTAKKRKIEERVVQLGQEHYYSFIASV